MSDLRKEKIKDTAHDACEKVCPHNPQAAAEAIVPLFNGVRELLSEHDNPVPDAMYRKVLRDRLAGIIARLDQGVKP
jgi:hypothetical protein